jgi:hypothetical protein
MADVKPGVLDAADDCTRGYIVYLWHPRGWQYWDRGFFLRPCTGSDKCRGDFLDIGVHLGDIARTLLLRLVLLV